MAKLVAQTEKQFQAAVVEYARLCGWRVYHTHDSRRSAPGFPDLVMVRRESIIFAELKSANGRVTADQRDWLADLRRVQDAILEYTHPDVLGGVFEVYLWRPEDWVRIEALLK